MVATPESSPAYSMSSTPWPDPEPGQALWKSQSWAGWTRDLEDELKTIQAVYDDYIDRVEDRLRSEKKRKKALIREVQRLNEDLDAAKKANDIEKMQRQNALALIDAARQELVTSASDETHESFDLPSTALITERIPALPDPTRNLLIDRFCPEDMPEINRNAPRNKDIVAQIYLGRRRAPSTPPPWNFSLRNYNLQPDQIHLSANVDSYDIEFVLGGSSQMTK
ncbi:hypothetical protein BDP81DRAFT_396763 [Colletotrichum phormii]|uniref:Uncharacterized protein n=1 Tax=Colletotrichum phormii TaxID=359342 RepID=A0AAJ0EBW7_9PEZI|nr:uncharacterized protein BDP81DRAFT_396763 [Colletotrichum phormii]KAK1634057.1 hypothetical protein BDP81DRAFT_396763 [Colletotrichum phormii]